MWPRSRSERGFTLTELLVTVAALVVVLTLSAQLLFATRRAADRQRLQTEPRQIARGAVDYVNYLVRTATDLNTVLGARNPLAVMVWYANGSNQLFQASYNNLTASQASDGLGDEGTDIITVAHADRANFVPLITWNGNQTSSTAYWEFNQGCPDSALNLAMFKELTGAHPDPDGGQDISDPIVIVDANGVAGTYQITDYKEGTNADVCEAKNQLPDVNEGCAANQGCMAVVANPGRSDQINPPGGQPNLSQPITMHLGPRFISLRVRNRWLEQKLGVFNPNTDNPGNAFQRLLPNVEDFQVAWIFNNGETRNNSAANRIPRTGAVPTQGSPADAYDAVNVTGMRVTFTARSAEAIPGEVDNRWPRPAAEDRDAAATRDQFFRYQLSATSMIRNRWVGR
jgi:prepilin-type N-terminal cleavage/methylation domain-containing protein